ncbi:hypothetical protein FISHEDRAFT_32699, partial [Fistulina hepatica ATCC 64428]
MSRNDLTEGVRASRLKPVPPEYYNGEANDELFWRYVTETNQYLQDGAVPPHRQVTVASRYLKGRAREYYIQSVLLSGETPLLDEWYQNLFDYCFPENYRDTCHANLRRCRQNGRDIQEYYFELTQWWNALGDATPHAQTVKFWEGLDGWMEEALIMDGYDIDVHTLEEVYARARVLQKAK